MEPGKQMCRGRVPISGTLAERDSASIPSVPSPEIQDCTGLHALRSPFPTDRHNDIGHPPQPIAKWPSAILGRGGKQIRSTRFEILNKFTIRMSECSKQLSTFVSEIPRGEPICLCHLNFCHSELFPI